MNRRELMLFFTLELVAILVAGLSFKFIESRFSAGMVAGAFFIISGFYMLLKAWAWRDRLKAFIIPPLFTHLFLISIPIMVVRLLNRDVNFEELTVWGVPGPMFHRISTNVFAVLILATIVDWLRSPQASRRKRKKN